VLRRRRSRVPRSAKNPAWGHCDVTALVLHDLLGGDLVLGEVHLNGEQHGYHWFGADPGRCSGPGPGGEEAVELDSAGEVVDHAYEPGEGGLEEDLEDRLGREAGLGGTVDGGAGDVAAASHDVPGQVVHCCLGGVRRRFPVPHGGDVGFIDAEARHEAVGGVLDPPSAGLVAALRSRPDVAELIAAPDLSAPPVPVVDLRFDLDGAVLAFFSVVSTVGTPIDVTAQELRLEAFFPADDTTRHRWIDGITSTWPGQETTLP
jgi:MmyB-like transcription regulator ligand binding domain